jgi:hypothetical protein
MEWPTLSNKHQYIVNMDMQVELSVEVEEKNIKLTIFLKIDARKWNCLRSFEK